MCGQGITPLLGRVDSNVNISDIPTRGANLPFETDQVPDLSFEEQLSVLAKEGIKAQTDGYFDPELLIGRLYSNVYARAGEGFPRRPFRGHSTGDKLFGLRRIGLDFVAGNSPHVAFGGGFRPWVLFGPTARSDFLSYANRITSFDPGSSEN